MARITIEKLAQMVMKGFNDMGGRIDALSEQMNERFAQVDMRFEEIDVELRYIKTDLNYVKEEVLEVKEKMVPPFEFEDLSFRVKYLEEKMGIESGK